MATTAALPTVDQLSACLSALTQPDTNTIRQAEQQLKPVLKNPASMELLWQVQSHSTDVAVRHVAAIVLRKRLPGHYSTSFDAATKMQWQNQVLQALAVEQVRPVRTGLIGVAAALQHVDAAASQPVLQFLAAASREQAPAARELCFLLLQEMTDTVGMHWKEHIQALLDLFASTLQNPNEDATVLKAAVQAAGQLMSFWADEPEMEYMAPLLPTMLQVAASAVHDEDFLAVVLDVLYDLAYSPATSLLQHLPLLVQFSLQCIRNRDLELGVRDAAALVIATAAEAKPKSFGRDTALLSAVLDCLFGLMQDSTESAAGALFESNPAWRSDLPGHDGADGDDDLDSPTETSMAQGTLDMLACEVPKRYIWQPALQHCMERMQNPTNAQARKAGVAGLGVIAEGCCEPLTLALPQVLPQVLQAAQDPAPAVRECACFCLGQLSEHCQPDILQYSSQILPIVFGLLDDQSVAVQATSCYVLEMFCERLEPAAVRPLLENLVRKLAQMLEATDKRSVQEMAVAALAATAVAAEQEFTPYVAGVANLMTKLMALQDPNLYSLRGRALECMGHIGIAVGAETFRPYFTATMQCAMEGLTTDSTDLQEFAYAVFANLAKVMKTEFAPALADLVPFLVRVIEQDEGSLEAQPDAAAQFTGLDDSDDEDETGAGNMVLHVRTALLDAKKGAITALGEMAAHTGTAFCPHLEVSMQVLQKAATNWHPLVKAEVADAFPSLIVPSIAAYHNGEIEWKKGDITTHTLSQHTQAIVGAVLTEEIALLEDDDKSTVAKALEAIQSVIELCGPSALGPVLDTLLQATHAFLTKQTPCQTVDARYGELPDDDDDHDVVLQAACDLIGAFARVIGGHFAQYLPQFLPAICEYGKSSRPPSDRGMAVGCLSEIAQELPGQSLLEHWKGVFLPASLQGLADEDENVERNAAFCVGLCCESLGEHAAGDYPAILPALGNVIGMETPTDSAMAAVDNAAAAVARMIMACPSQVPMEQVMPVFLRALPLKTDMTENETIFKCLMGLAQMKHPAVPGAELHRIFQAGIANSKVSDEWRSQLQAALPSIAQ